MPETSGLEQPAIDAPPEAWTAYRQAWSERAMAAHRQHGEALLSELRAKIQYADCERALAAFTRVLDAAGADPWTAARAQFKLESWDGRGFPQGEGLDQTEHNAATAWRDAVQAARVELCDKAPFVSAEAFGLVDFLGRDPAETFEQVFPLSLMKS
jgi:hypothetical protein